MQNFRSKENYEVKNLNVALILSGGIGSRMQMDGTPKQYLMVRGRPIIDYSLQTFQKNEMIDYIFIVADSKWHAFLNDWICKSGIRKFQGYAVPGECRQLSILNGLDRIQAEMPRMDNVIIHDAARPLVSSRLITKCLLELKDADGVMPAIPVKDTCYQSEDGKSIGKIIPRSEIFAGQAPEAFRMQPYIDAHRSVSSDSLKEVSGSSEFAYKHGLNVKIITGSEQNIKITTKNDLYIFEQYLDCGEDQ